MTPDRSWGKLAQRIRVPTAMVLGVVFLVLMQPSPHSLWVGGLIAACGSMLRIWAAGHIEKGRTLAQDGPYALTQNPLYLGSALMALGVFVAGREYWLLIPATLFYAGIYYPVIKAENSELADRYGDAFQAYASRVPRFLPRLRGRARPGGGIGQSRFSWSRVVRNGEHRTVAGLLLVEIFLIMKTLA